MISSSTGAVRGYVRVLRLPINTLLPVLAPPSQRQRRIPQTRWESVAATSSASSPKISEIVDRISQLTLLETADLVSSLKVCANLSTFVLSVVSD